MPKFNNNNKLLNQNIQMMISGHSASIDAGCIRTRI